MSIVGFNFSKIVIEKNKNAVGKVSIANNLSIKEVKEAKLNLGSKKQSGLEFVFQYTSKYQPEIGKIDLNGFVIYMEAEAKIQEILGSWKKDKKIPKETLEVVYNNILTKCNIEALLLSREVQLPPPIPLPKVAPR